MQYIKGQKLQVTMAWGVRLSRTTQVWEFLIIIIIIDKVDQETQQSDARTLVKWYQSASITSPEMEYNHYDSKHSSMSSKLNFYDVVRNYPDTHNKDKRKRIVRKTERFNEIQGKLYYKFNML